MENRFSLKQLFPPILFISTVGLVATDIYLPSFPAITKEFTTTKELVQFSFSLYLLTFSLSQLFYGPYSERHGRKKVAIFGLIFSLLGTSICILAPSISILILGRMLQGLGLGIGPALFRAILRDSFTGNTLAHISSFIAVGTACMMAAAPTLGGYIQDYLGWRFNFGFIFLYTLIGAIIIWKWLPETLLKPDATATKIKTAVRKFLHLLTSPIFMGYALCGSLAFAGLAAYLTVSPFLFQDILGFTPIQYGWLALIIAASLAFGGVLNSLFVRKVGRHRMLIYGVSMMIFGSLLMLSLSPYFVNAYVILIPVFFYICGAGVSFGNCNAGALHHFPKLAGFGGALYGTLQILVSSIGTSVMAVVHERNQIPLSIYLMVISLICFFFQWLGHRASKQVDES